MSEGGRGSKADHPEGLREGRSSMATVLRISDAATLALHTMVLLADRRERPRTAKEIASTFKVSEAHLAKVLQRLAKAGLVLSAPGPHGGFHLRDGAERTTLLQVYEAIEGPMSSTHCLLGVPVWKEMRPRPAGLQSECPGQETFFDHAAERCEGRFPWISARK
jgi:Rrf2 family protein